MFCPQCGNDLSKMPDAPVCPTCGQAIAPSQTFASPQVHPGAPLPPWPGTPTQASGWSGTPTAPIASDGTATGAPGTAPAPPLEAYAAPEAPKSRRRLGRALGALGVVIVLALALTIVQGVRGRSAGAASPDDLVKRLQQATVKVDPAAALALLDPDEVPGLGDLYKTAVTQARKGADVRRVLVAEGIVELVQAHWFAVLFDCFDNVINTASDLLFVTVVSNSNCLEVVVVLVKKG